MVRRRGSPSSIHGSIGPIGMGMFSRAVGPVRTWTDLAELRDFQIGQNIAQVQAAAVSSEQRLEQDASPWIQERNADIDRGQTIGRPFSTLNQCTGPGLADPDVWDTWWTSQLIGVYARQSDTASTIVTVDQTMSPTFVPQLEQATSTPYSVRAASCFGAGTPVRTLTGSMPIESIRVGDRVLTQDIKTGALGYHPVTVVHHNPPSPTFLVKVGKDTIVSSPFHRFWVAGKGWKMARDLKGGETLRLLDGPARVDSVEEGPVQLVYNLDVAGDHDFFAGAAAALVHDNTLPDTRLVAFDAAPVVAVAESKGR